MFEFEIMSESAANKVMSPQRRSVRRERLSGMPRTRMLRHASIMLRFWGSLRPQRLGGAFLQRSHVWNNPRRQASPRIVEGKMPSLAGWVAALRAGETPTRAMQGRVRFQRIGNMPERPSVALARMHPVNQDLI